MGSWFKVLPWSKHHYFFLLQILESMIGQHLTGKILSFDFYPKAIYFEYKFWISRSAITRIPN